MIARIWHGCVPSAKAQEYLELVRRQEIPDLRAMPGNVGVQLMAREQGPLTYLLVVSFWQDEQSILNFAGDDIDVAKYYPHDKDYLVEFETHVVHYDVVEDTRNDTSM